MNIFVVIESIFVGMYTMFIYFLVKNLGFPKMENSVFLFCVGFFKHFLGYFFRLHSYYCKYGYACKKNKISNSRNIFYRDLFFESIGEGFIFILFGIGMMYFFSLQQNYLLYGMLGFFLHIFSEIFGIHKIFCQTCTFR